MRALLASIMVIVVSVSLILLIREIVCWYWKINDLLKEIKQVNINAERQIKILQAIDYKLSQQAINGNRNTPITNKKGDSKEV